jgi:cell pole-organizing protein PopZ
MGSVEAGMDMAQSNVAREPSMDEILASIRKIIESNELDASDTSRDMPTEKGAALEAAPLRPEIMEDRRVPVEPASTERETHKTMSLGDLAARVRSVSDQRFAENASAYTELAEIGTDPARAHGHHEPVFKDDHRFDNQAIAVMGDTEAEPLMSEDSGRHVARSFGDLAAVLNASQHRSLDEIAEDMLRPMLSDWLDDNLPKLVERLVREEIERVARGPRR